MTHHAKRREGAITGLFAIALLAMAGDAFAGEPLSGDQIKAKVADMTVQGKMSDGSAYSEFYQADGTIKAKDYAGKWDIEGNAMCFVYASAPTNKMCFQVGENSTGIDWMKDGKVEGSGTVTKGNVMNY